MHISRIGIFNFRLLKESVLDLRPEISLLVGKNNTGKTSLLVLLERFFKKKRFHYDDFPIALRDELNKFDENSNIEELAIRLILDIKYEESDDLSELSEFILDLNPDNSVVKILFECRIDRDSLLAALSGVSKEDKGKYISKNLSEHLLEREIFAIDSVTFENNSAFIQKERHKFVKKDLRAVEKLINLQIIHARRNLSSSEDDHGNKKPLSTLTTSFFSKTNDTPNDERKGIDKLLSEMDSSLGTSYDAFFKDFLESSKTFLDLENLSVRSNIQSQMLMQNSSEVVYGTDQNNLPEHLNGLGFLNILFLLLNIEVKKDDFGVQNRDINLLLIEEPEAHTHPQMQYLFANHITSLLDKIPNVQTLITSHSSHIVSQSDFENIRYLKLTDDNVEFRNFHTELESKYTVEGHFQFLKQYLNLQSAELFFASKAIFIEGISEQMLLPYFQKKVDEEIKLDEEIISTIPPLTPLASQNITVMEVGANAKIFAPFIEFLGIKTLIITDIDTSKRNEKNRDSAEPVATSSGTTNATIKHFFEAPEDIKSSEFQAWFAKLKSHDVDTSSSNIKVAYQENESDYHARSFEDSFLKINLELIKTNKDKLWGLKNVSDLDSESDIYLLTNSILDKKSDFAASLLFLALSNEEIQWNIPNYIKEGLKWIAAS